MPQRPIAAGAASAAEQDVEAQVRERRAQFASKIGKYLTWANLSLFVPMMVAWLFFRGYSQFLHFAVVCLIMAGGSALYPFFRRGNRHVLGARVFIASFLAGVFSAPLMIPGLMPAVAVAYSIIALLICLTLGVKKGRWLLGNCLVALVGDILLVSTVAADWFPPLNETVALVASVSVGFGAMGVAAIIAYMVVSSQEGFFCESKLAYLEVETRAIAEQEQRTHLERAKKEIEQRAATEREQRERLR